MTPNSAPPRRTPGKRISLILAIGVHLLLAALLFYGIHWQTKVKDVVEVDLVRALPPAPVPTEETPPATRPEPKPEPKAPPPRPEPKPEPKLPPPKPAITIKEKEPPKPPPKEEAKPEPKPKVDPFRQQMLEEEKQRALHKQIAEEERLLQQQRDSMAAAGKKKALAAYTDRIKAKIKGNIVLPPDLRGNPTALFKVTQLPSGEIISVQLLRTSGHPGYDGAVERAILKSSPLPKPEDPALFDRILNLTFCPMEDGKCS